MAATDNTRLRTAEVGAREKSTDNCRDRNRSLGVHSADVPSPCRSGAVPDIYLVRSAS
jgi:hypothetical protein